VFGFEDQDNFTLDWPGESGVKAERFGPS